MKSYEAIQKAINGKTIEHAKKLGLSAALLHKWQEPCTDFTDSGAYNPLDRIETIIETSIALGIPKEEAFAPIFFLAQKFNLILTPLDSALRLRPGPAQQPKEEKSKISELSEDLLTAIGKFGDLAKDVSEALLDKKITKLEAEQINKAGWQLIENVNFFIKKIKESNL